MPSDDNGGTAHGFKFRAPVGRFLHVVVKDGVQGIGGYLSGKPYVDTVEVEPYPKTLTFLGEGALLSLSGDRQVGFLVRDVDHVEVEIARVLPNQLQHVAPLMGNIRAAVDLQRPRGPAGRALHDQPLLRRPRRRASRSTTASTSASTCRIDKAQTRRGLFLLHIRAKAPDPDDGRRRVERRRRERGRGRLRAATSSDGTGGSRTRG